MKVEHRQRKCKQRRKLQSRFWGDLRKGFLTRRAILETKPVGKYVRATTENQKENNVLCWPSLSLFMIYCLSLSS